VTSDPNNQEERIMQSREEAKNSQRSRPESARFLNYLETASQWSQITPDHFIAH
jgi:serine/threonine protein kinase